MSVVWPPSHCPRCRASIPWYRNIPVVSWVWQRGRCAGCGLPISPRYLGVEALTGCLFLASWIEVGRDSVVLALVYCLIVSGLIVATFIDFEHFIIPDGITIGGMAAGVAVSFAFPALHGETARAGALLKSVAGMAIGAGIVYAILRLGKLLFGRQSVALEPDTRLIFTETALVLPDESLPYEDIFYRKSDTIVLDAKRVELVDRCYRSVPVRLRPECLTIGTETFNPETVPYMEVVTDHVVLPREAMGFGDVKFMGAIGAFLGYQAAIFSLAVSSMLGAAVGGTLILLRHREWSSRIPYGPYIALAALIWMFGGNRLMDWWLAGGLTQWAMVP
jgi:leader peptidase (prepilin peptidase)/N-methyltransferase